MKDKLKKIVTSKLFTLVVFLILVIVVCEIGSKGVLLKSRNIKSILQSVAVAIFLAIGSGMLLLAGHSDVSLGGVGTLGPIVLAVMLRAENPLWLSVLVSLVACGLCGFFNAVMVNWLHYPTFIATLAMASISQGIAYILAKGEPVNIKNDVLAFIGTKRLFNAIPYTFIIALVALIFYSILMTKTKLGRSVYIIGDNMEAARLTGLKPVKVSFFLFINASVLAGVAGLLMSARLKVATCAGLAGRQFDGMTASMLGGISFGGGEGGLMGILIGIFILNIFNNGLELMSVSVYWQTVAQGLLLFAALLYDMAMTKRKQKMALK